MRFSILPSWALTSTNSSFKNFPCPACAELGLVSQQIHKYGRFAENWASLQYRNVVGLLLCAVIVSLLITIFHFYLSIACTVSRLPLFNRFSYLMIFSFNLVVAFFSLILSVFFGIGGGVIRTTTPFHRSCSTPTENYPEKWQRFAGECTRIVAMQGISWALCTSFFLSSLVQVLTQRPFGNQIIVALYFFVLVGSIAYMFRFTKRPTPGGFYGSYLRSVV